MTESLATPAAPASAAATDAAVLDVRALACSDRHATIFQTFQSLSPGQSLLLVNDHDPRPLRGHFDLRYPGQYAWTYVEAGPMTWAVRIHREADRSGSCCGGGRCAG